MREILKNFKSISTEEKLHKSLIFKVKVLMLHIDQQNNFEDYISNNQCKCQEILMLSNANEYLCEAMLMLSNTLITIIWISLLWPGQFSGKKLDKILEAALLLSTAQKKNVVLRNSFWDFLMELSNNHSSKRDFWPPSKWHLISSANLRLPWILEWKCWKSLTFFVDLFFSNLFIILTFLQKKRKNTHLVNP